MFGPEKPCFVQLWPPQPDVGAFSKLLSIWEQEGWWGKAVFKASQRWWRGAGVRTVLTLSLPSSLDGTFPSLVFCIFFPWQSPDHGLYLPLCLSRAHSPPSAKTLVKPFFHFRKCKPWAHSLSPKAKAAKSFPVSVLKSLVINLRPLAFPSLGGPSLPCNLWPAQCLSTHLTFYASDHQSWLPLLTIKEPQLNPLLPEIVLAAGDWMVNTTSLGTFF